MNLQSRDGSHLVCTGLASEPGDRASNVGNVGNVGLLVSLLGAERGLQARNVASEETGPDGSHVVLVFGQVNKNDGPSRLVQLRECTSEVAHTLIERTESLGLDGRVMSGGSDEVKLVRWVPLSGIR